MLRVKIFFVMILFLVLATFKAEAATDWNNLTVTTTAIGVAPEEYHGLKAKVIAKRTALVIAYRQLAEIINGVHVNSETTIENMTLTSDIIRTRIDTVIKGAQIISERELEGNGCEITLQLPMFSVSGGLAEAVIERPAEIIPFPEPAISIESKSGGASNYTVIEGGENSPMKAIGNYTGLIVDCRGMNLNPVMSPVIKNSSGTKLYGHENLNYDLVVSEGMASYADDISQTSRAGNNPLIIKAQTLADNNSNPVVAIDDGNRILIENGKTGFLNDTAVVFLK